MEQQQRLQQQQLAAAAIAAVAATADACNSEAIPIQIIQSETTTRTALLPQIELQYQCHDATKQQQQQQQQQVQQQQLTKARPC
ncbi:hypothetical protein Emag_000380 [Eimeria magna]